MDYKGTNADPDKLGNLALKQVLGESGPYSDAPVLPVYRTREYDGKRYGKVIFFEVLGCNSNCAHCYVSEDHLRAKLDSSLLQKRLQKLPGNLKGKLLHSSDELYEYGRNRYARTAELKGRALELTGGEPTLYRGGIKRLAERAQDDGVLIVVKSNGYLIASDEGYLDAFSGLEDTLKFSFSVRGTTEQEAQRFSGVKSPGYHLAPFIAAKKVIERGFEEPLLDVTIDTIADPESLGQDDNPITRLKMFFEGAGFENFRNMDVNRITQQIYGNRFPGLDRKMVERGYWSIDESGEFVKYTDPKAVEDFFEEKYGLKL
jgi:uncharacterized Fe-S cluster-containing radical SAM superfamily protein